MKASIVIAVLILALGALIGWQDQRKLSRLRETQVELTTEARALGLLDPSGRAADSQTGTKRTARDVAASTARAKAFAAELIAFAVDMKAVEESGDQPDAEMKKQIFVMIDRLLELDRDEIRILIAEVRASSQLTDKMRQEIIGFSVMMLANDHPQAALALFTESSDLLEGLRNNRHVVAGALSQWAKNDPMAALGWIREHSKSHPDLITDSAKSAIVAGAAVQDPRLAFSLLDELEIDNINRSTSAIVAAARSSEQRVELLAAMRSRIESLDDQQQRNELTRAILHPLSRQMVGEGFDSTMTWLAETQLSDKELEQFAEGIHRSNTGEDTGRWIEWMADKLPSDDVNNRVRNLVSSWTRDDYAATGEWLNSTTPGPAREPAIRAFAETVAPYEPATAANWALTLPAGNDRTTLLRSIHNQWQAQDESAAAEFARKHNLEE